MTYNVFGGTLNIAQSINQSIDILKVVDSKVWNGTDTWATAGRGKGALPPGNVVKCLCISSYSENLFWSMFWGALAQPPPLEMS